MKLFENEIITIDRIYAVEKYESTYDDPDFYEYGTDFKTYELVIVLSGESIAEIDGICINDTAGSVRYMSKGKISGRYLVNRTKPGACIDIYFDTRSSMPDGALGVMPKKYLGDKAVKLYKTWQSKKKGYYTESMMLFYDIIRSIKEYDGSYLQSGQKAKIQKAYEYMVQNYRMCKFDYKQLCAESGFKYTSFNEMFKKTYGMTPVQAVTKMKIDYAKELLITGRYSVSDIAEMCGFENVYYFSSVFKKQTGFSPSKYPFE